MRGDFGSLPPRSTTFIRTDNSRGRLMAMQPPESAAPLVPAAPLAAAPLTSAPPLALQLLLAQAVCQLGTDATWPKISQMVESSQEWPDNAAKMTQQVGLLSVRAPSDPNATLLPAGLRERFQRHDGLERTRRVSIREDSSRNIRARASDASPALIADRLVLHRKVIGLRERARERSNADLWSDAFSSTGQETDSLTLFRSPRLTAGAYPLFARTRVVRSSTSIVPSQCAG